MSTAAHAGNGTSLLYTRTMRTMLRDEYERLIDSAVVLSGDSRGEKVLQCADGRIIKLFRRKRLVSSAMFRPYASRFVDGARQLQAIGIATVKVLDTFRLPHMDRNAVVYEPCPGETLRDSLAAATQPAALMKSFAAFVAHLHEAGVYFRAIHFANVLVLDDGEFGLIDVSEVKMHRRPLGPGPRARNFKPMVKYAEDRDAIEAVGVDRFLAWYIEAARLQGAARQRFESGLQRALPAGFFSPAKTDATIPNSGV